MNEGMQISLRDAVFDSLTIHAQRECWELEWFCFPQPLNHFASLSRSLHPHEHSLFFKTAAGVSHTAENF
jgi:hypothetical protein